MLNNVFFKASATGLAAFAAIMALPATSHAQEGSALLPYNYATTKNYSLSDELSHEREVVKVLKETVVLLEEKLKDAETCTNTTTTVTTPTGSHGGTPITSNPGATKPVAAAASAGSSCQYSATVCSFYKSTTGGLPEAAGANYWQAEINKLKASGQTEAQALAAIKAKAALLPEVVNKAGTGSATDSRASVNTAGTVTAKATTAEKTSVAKAQTTSNQLDSIYANTLGRTADAAGKAYYTAQIAAGKMTTAQVAAHITACAKAGTCK